MSTENARESEIERRRQAQEAVVEIVDGSAEPVPSRKLDQMVSLRLDPDLLAELKAIAETAGISVSDCIRDAVSQWISCMDMSTVKIDFLRIETGIQWNLPAGDAFDTKTTFSNLAQEGTEFGRSADRRGLPGGVLA